MRNRVVAYEIHTDDQVRVYLVDRHTSHVTGVSVVAQAAAMAVAGRNVTIKIRTTADHDTKENK